MKPRISVLIINYFKSADIERYMPMLDSQRASVDIEVLIWDNSCDADESERLKNLDISPESLTISRHNIGYTKAANQLASKSSGDYIFLMSPDIDPVGGDTFSQLLKFSELHPNSVISPRQVNRDGTVPSIARRFPTPLAIILNRIGLLTSQNFLGLCTHYLYTENELKADIAVDWIQSSALLIRRSIWDAAGGLDERFFIFMADVELGISLRRHGYDMRLCMNTTVTADGKRASNVSLLKTTADILNKGALYWHIRDAFKYFYERKSN
jgi:N-acetylglucosaminyl-diphospho-decaprenol L-rhamnosyltransferase